MIDETITKLCAMHNNQPSKIGWVEQTALRDACEALAKMRAALDWYAEMAKTMRKAMLHVDNQVALHVMKEMALDGGDMARKAMTPNAPSSPAAKQSGAKNG